MITSIPTAARGKVRAFVKGHSQFEAFAQSLGIERPISVRWSYAR